MSHGPVYLDYHATTPVDPRVLEAMLPYFTEVFGNPASVGHQFGWKAGEAVEVARKQVSQLIGCAAREITFTDGKKMMFGPPAGTGDGGGAPAAEGK